MNKQLFILVFLASSFIGFSQEYQLKFTSRAAAGKMIYLGSYYGERITPIDSARADEKGSVKFKLPASRSVGMYRFILNKDMFSDFIFNHENVDIQIDVEKFEDGIRISESVENELYYSFLKTERDFRKRVALLLPLLDEYPRKDPFYGEILKQANQLQDEYQKAAETIGKKHPGSFVSRLIAIRLDNPINFKFSANDRKSDLKLRFFENKNFADTSLLRSNAYPNKLIEYLSLYANPEFSQSQLEKEFIRAVDMIFGKVQMSKEIYDFSLTYLAGGFEKFKFEDVLVHIHDKYLSGLLCDEDKTKKDLAFRLEAFRKLAVGKQAPDMLLNMPDGSVASLNQIKSEYCLIVFWAAWCPHCTQMIPDLDKLSKQISPEKLQIISVSLDTTDTDRQKLLGKLSGNILHQCDFQGWNSPRVKDFHIYATPTMFLIDKRRTILAKPIILNDLADALLEKNIR